MNILTTLPEKALVPLTIGTANHPTTTDTSGNTVSCRLVPVTSAGFGTPVEVGTASGAVAGTNVTVNMDLTTAGITTGIYALECIADLGGANDKTLVPNPTVGFPAYVRIHNVQSVT